jgi:hypothetical protein
MGLLTNDSLTELVAQLPRTPHVIWALQATSKAPPKLFATQSQLDTPIGCYSLPPLLKQEKAETSLCAIWHANHPQWSDISSGIVRDLLALNPQLDTPEIAYGLTKDTGYWHLICGVLSKIPVQDINFYLGGSMGQA